MVQDDYPTTPEMITLLPPKMITLDLGASQQMRLRRARSAMYGCRVLEDVGVSGVEDMGVGGGV